jgi:hypothetical protein
MTTKCPNCGTEIDIDAALSRQWEEKIKKEYAEKFSVKENDLKKEKEALEKEKALADEKFKKQLSKRIIIERTNLEKEIKLKVEDEQSLLLKHLKDELTEKSEKLKNFGKVQAEIEELKRNLSEQESKIQAEAEKKLTAALNEERKKTEKKMEEENSSRFNTLEKELNEKSEKLKKYAQTDAENEKLKRKMDEQKTEFEAAAEKKLTVQLHEQREKLRKDLESGIELKLKEKEEIIEQLKQSLKDAQQKADQGSMQLQGEVQEIAIEQYLKSKFPLDTIEEVKKGARGADCIQVVNTYSKQNCGSIYYESKRTKTFQADWIGKFKSDMLEKAADIGVLVTDAMPPEMNMFGQKEGIWICSFSEFKALCVVLRETIIQVSNALSSQENKGDKMLMLYNFLTSNEFRLQIEAIVEGFNQMRDDLEKEKKAVIGLWKRREKQIEKVSLNTNFMYNSFKGIAGNAIQPVLALELIDEKKQIGQSAIQEQDELDF